MKQALAAAVIASLMMASSAKAEVERYDVKKVEMTLTIDAGRIHTFEVNLNDCDNTFSGVGTSRQGPFGDGAYYYDFAETVTGTYDPATGAITFVASYEGDEPVNSPSDPSFAEVTGVDLTGYVWQSDAPFTTLGYWHSNMFGGEAGSAIYLSNWIVTGGTYKNHGQYVKANKGVDDAAHSCIGMPKVAQSAN
jgi:hypothetical protein